MVVIKALLGITVLLAARSDASRYTESTSDLYQMSPQQQNTKLSPILCYDHISGSYTIENGCYVDLTLDRSTCKLSTSNYHGSTVAKKLDKALKLLDSPLDQCVLQDENDVFLKFICVCHSSGCTTDGDFMINLLPERLSTPLPLECYKDTGLDSADIVPPGFAKLPIEQPTTTTDPLGQSSESTWSTTSLPVPNTIRPPTSECEQCISLVEEVLRKLAVRLPECDTHDGDCFVQNIETVDSLVDIEQQRLTGSDCDNERHKIIYAILLNRKETLVRHDGVHIQKLNIILGIIHKVERLLDSYQARNAELEVSNIKKNLGIFVMDIEIEIVPEDKRGLVVPFDDNYILHT